MAAMHSAPGHRSGDGGGHDEAGISRLARRWGRHPEASLVIRHVLKKHDGELHKHLINVGKCDDGADVKDVAYDRLFEHQFAENEQDFQIPKGIAQDLGEQ